MNTYTAPYFIGVDFGTQGVRTGIIDSCGRILSQCEQSYTTYYPNVGWAVQKPHEWWEAFRTALGESLQAIDESDRNKITACCVCATSSTILPVDINGNPLSDAILWMDSRAVDEAEKINNTKHPLLKYCGGEVSVEWLVPKALWIRNNDRDLYDRSFRIIEQLDWINYKLSGEWVASKCNATCKWNYVDIEGGWNDDYFKAIDFSDYKNKLNLDVKRIGEPIGKIKSDFAEEFKLPLNIVLVQGGIDAHMSMLGLGATSEEKTSITLGTSFVHLALSKEPVFQNGIWGPYHNAVLPDYWLLEGGQISAGSLVKWFKETFGVNAENPYGLLGQEALKIPIGAEGLVALDYFQGNRTPWKDPNAKGVLFGLNLKHTRAHIYRAVLESVAFGTRSIIDNFIDQGCKIDSLVVCGGVTKDPVWLQIIADVTNKNIIITKNMQAGTLGCCIAAAVGTGVYNGFEYAASCMVQEAYRIEPNQENHAFYAEPYGVYQNLYSSLKHLMKK